MLLFPTTTFFHRPCLAAIIPLARDNEDLIEIGRAGLIAALVAFLITTVIAPLFIKLLKQLKIKQVFRTKEQVRELATLHGSKAGIPTMGGLIIGIGAIFSTILFTNFNKLVIISLVVYALGTLLGVADDLLKIKHGNSSGIPAKYKLILPGMIVVGLMVLAHYDPLVWKILMDVEWLSKLGPKLVTAILLIFYFFVIAGTSNAVNLTDGIDGLAITNITTTIVFFATIALCSVSNFVLSGTLLTPIDGAHEIYMMCCCFAGACTAFYMFNRNPASVFMGDTGSIGLGAFLATIAILLRQPFALLSVGIIFVIEALSVMIQMTSKKLFKRKIFLMSPVHHHFELKGYSERKIVRVAGMIQFLFIMVTFAIVFHGYIFVD